MHGRNLFKILGLSMLAAISVMAVSASAAQANWLIRVGGVSVGSANLKATIGGGEMTVPGLLKLACTGGSAEAEVKTAESGAKLLGSGSATFEGCVVKDSGGTVNKFCTANSPEQEAGTIVAEGSGEGKMEDILNEKEEVIGEKTFAKLESNEFTFVEISGALCPLTENSAEVSGSATLTLANAEAEAKAHDVELNDEKLFYGENSAELTTVTGSATEEGGEAWALQLVGL